jgi:hypothetical protein
LNFWAELVYNFTSRNSVLSGAEALMRPLHSPPAMLLRPDASSAWLMPWAHTASPRAWRAAPILLPFFRCNSAWPKARCCEPCWAAELPARWCHPLLVKARGARGDGLSIVANPRVEQRAAELESDCDNLRKGAGRRAARRTRTRERQRRTYKRNARPPAYGSSTCKPVWPPPRLSAPRFPLSAIKPTPKPMPDVRSQRIARDLRQEAQAARFRYSAK